jgi:TM2 domain-containing membrane protein YozV
MKCTNHPRADAVASCERCGKDLCEDCVVRIGSRPWCGPCLEEIVLASSSAPRRASRPSSSLVAGLLSIVPGAGHMYLGLIGKGFAILGLLLASVFLVVLYSDATGMYWMTAYLAPSIGLLLLSYAVFDSLAIAESLRAGRAPRGDPTMDAIAERVLLNRRTGGWTILLAGVVGILHFLDKAIGQALRSSLGIDVPVAAFVVPAVLLVIGIRLLAKGKGAPRD